MSNKNGNKPTGQNFPQIITLDSSSYEAEIRQRARDQGVPLEEVEAFLEEIRKAKKEKQGRRFAGGNEFHRELRHRH